MILVLLQLVPVHQSSGGMTGDGAQSYAATVISAAKVRIQDRSTNSDWVEWKCIQTLNVGYRVNTCISPLLGEGCTLLTFHPSISIANKTVLTMARNMCKS